MKLLFFSPVAHNSAIANVTSKIVLGLNENPDHNIFLVDTGLLKEAQAEFGNIEILDKNSHQIEKLILSGFVPVYQVGNHYGNHVGIFKWIFEHSGIVIFHDRYLGDLYKTYTIDSGSKHLDNTYVKGSEANNYELRKIDLHRKELVDSYSRLEFLAPYASCAITHDILSQ